MALLGNVSIDGLLEFAGLRKIPKYGVAFAGGGARGFAHIGVISAMEQFGIRPQILSGVSAGSIAAVLYGAGLTPDDMIECFAESQKFGDFTEFSVPTAGFFRLDKFGKLLQKWLPVTNLEDLKIPTVVCATNFDKGTAVGWCKGEIVPRVLASCSIPIIFRPVIINGTHYVDGGVLRNLPAWAIRDFCKVLIGSNCSPLNRKFKYKPSLLDIAERSFHLMSKANVTQDMKLCDHVIMPEAISESKTFDLTSLRKNVRIGYDAACRVLEKMV
mgnify:CR=1 FL=1